MIGVQNPSAGSQGEEALEIAPFIFWLEWPHWKIAAVAQGTKRPIEAADRLVPFLTHVWPRQRDVRTASVSARLADLAIAIPDRFPEIVEVILPRLVPVHGATLRISPFLIGESSNTIARRHPQTLLNLLWAILDVDPATWPNRVDKHFSQLAESADSKRSEIGGVETSRTMALE